MSQLLVEPEMDADEARPLPRRSEEAPKSAPRLKVKTKTRLQLVTKHVMLWIRRGHLYFGLFLFPWALLYGVTAFLFNHPMAFSDQKLITFVRADYDKGSTAALLTSAELANELIEKLNAAQKPAIAYQLGKGEIRFNREFAFATFKTDANSYNILLDLNNGSGTIREQSAPRGSAGQERLEHAPFAVGEMIVPPGARRSSPGPRPAGERRGGAPGAGHAGLETLLKSQVEGAIPKICESAKIACKDVVVTSIPELSFPIRVGEEEWTAIYNPLNGSVSGRKATEAAPSELSFRRFLLRLHTAHGYPSNGGVRWAWAVIVDVMAGIMCFWGISGILMWWQIKSTRLVGLATVSLGLIAAAGLGVGMHFAMR
jgi:hypothetical protein